MILRFCLFFGLLACATSIGARVAAQGGHPREVLVVRASAMRELEASAIADRIVERSTVNGVDLVRAPAPRASDDVDHAAEALLRADEAFAALAFDDAAREIDAALAATDASGVRSRATLVDVLLLAVMLHGAMGDSAQADASARDALAIEPTLEIDPARYPPTLSARIDQARSLVSRCALRVRVDPSDAHLTIDGASMSPPPAELGCGTHWVTASRVGYVSATERVVLTPATETEPASSLVVLALTLDPASALAAPGAPGEPIPALTERGAATLGRELVVLDVASDEQGGLLATFGGRSVRLAGSPTPDEVASALLAPLDHGLDTGVAIGIGAGVGAVVLAALAIAIGFAVTPSSPSGWNGIGEVIVP